MPPIAQPTRSSCLPVPREQWVEVTRVPAIVTEEQFERVQAKMAENRRLSKRHNTTHEYL